MGSKPKIISILVVFLLDCPLVLFLFKHRDVKAFFWTKKIRIPNRENFLNNSIDKNNIQGWIHRRKVYSILLPLNLYKSTVC